jgi:hypothetical protein
MSTGTTHTGELGRVELDVDNRLTKERAIRLITCNDDELPHLLEAARTAREQFHGRVVTYSGKVFIPPLRISVVIIAGIASFRRDPDQLVRTRWRRRK